jgi:hypothetical protein
VRGGKTLPASATAAKAGHVGGGPGLVDENQLGRFSIACRKLVVVVDVLIAQRKAEHPR